ncbi:MAG TPA: ATP-binding protein [Paenibacillus sp.]|uniref:ATP-binding protein n=1 Tax=Paenibacillus sp. TaxID=58172 RepID=UPI0028D8542E|nr:ATP-binding protein [Paenibacillus sp.]HUC93674.1 ATP-binding protein [Paenibacillus sp.]
MTVSGLDNDPNRSVLYPMLDRMTDGFYAMDSDGRCVYANAAAYRLVFRDQSSLIGKLLPDDLPDTAHSELFARVGQAMLRQRAERFDYFDGSSGTWLNVSVFPSAEGISVLLRDITADKQAAEQTEDLLRKSEKLKMAGQLAAGIAHEIRNPLTSLKGFSKLLRGASGEQAERYHHIMENEFNRIEMILGELLVLAKPQTAVYQTWDARLIVQDVLDLLGSQAILNDVVIHTDIHAGNCSVKCEKNQIKQVIMNVVKNAIEAMPEGGNLRVAVGSSGGEVLIRVADEGVGIAEDKLLKLGEPFYTTKDRGTGLGLMVSYRIIEEHEGKIEFKSKPGEGTEVCIRLPGHEDPSF